MGTSAVTVLGGLGLFLLGIHHLTEGLKGLAGDSLRRALQTVVGGRLSAVVSGALFTVLVQSSTATTLTVISFVSAGLVTFSQAVGVIIGATFGPPPNWQTLTRARVGQAIKLRSRPW